VAHRDIKPENCKLKGSDKDLVLYDFGASKCFDDSSDDQVFNTTGTYNYSAPETVTHG